MLYDTGSQANLIKKSVCIASQLENLQPSSTEIRGLISTPISILGTVRLRLHLDNLVFSDTFFVINDDDFTFPCDGILSRQFMAKHHLYLTGRNDRVQHYGVIYNLHHMRTTPLTPPPTDSPVDRPDLQTGAVVLVTVAKNVTLPPLSLTFVRTKISHQKFGDHVLLAYQGIHDNLFPVEAIYPITAKYLQIAMINPNSTTRELPKNLKLGELIPLDPVVLSDTFDLDRFSAPEYFDTPTPPYLTAIPTKISSVPDLSHLSRPERVLRDVNLDGVLEDAKRPIEDLIKEFSDIFILEGEALTVCNSEPVQIPMRDNTPVNLKPYPVPDKVRDLFFKEVDDLLEQGIIEETDSPFSSPSFLLVKQKDGKTKTRLICDYRAVNAQMQNGSHPIPLIQQTINSLAGSTVFSTVDCSRAFNQLALDDNSKQILAFSTPRGQMAWTRLSFGPKLAPYIWQKTIDRALLARDGHAAIAYADDLICHASNYVEHLRRLRLLFECLRESNLKIKGDKVSFAQEKITYLGFEICKDGIQPSHTKIDAILNIPVPKTTKQAKSYAAALLYYKSHLPDLARILIPLYRLTRKNQVFKWTPECQNAFDKSKQILAQRTLLAFLNDDTPPILTIDASSSGTGVCLSQIQRGQEVPIAFASKKFPEVKRCLPSYRLELMGLIFAVNTFKNFLFLRKFMVRTDAKALVYLKTSKKLSPVLQRYAILLDEFDFALEHIKGKNNTLADLISRIDYSKTPTEYAEDQKAPTVETFEQWEKRMNLAATPAEQPPKSAPTLSLRSCLKSSDRSKPMRKVTFKPDFNFKIVPSRFCSVFHLVDNSDKPWFEEYFPLNIIKDKQKTDPKLGEILFDMNEHRVSETSHYIINEAGLLFRKRSAQHFVLCIPSELGRDFVQKFHSSVFHFHSGFYKMRKALHKIVSLAQMSQIIKTVLLQCELCQTRKQNSRTIQPEMKQYEIPCKPMERVHLDFLTLDGRQQSASKYPHALIVVCAFSKFVVLIPTKSLTASELISRFLKQFVSKFGCPRICVTDNGPCFTSDIFAKFCRGLQFEHRTITPYVAQSNGQAEAMVKSSKDLLKLYLGLYPDIEWHNLAPFIELGLNNSVSKSTQYTPFQILYGREIHFPGERFLDFHTKYSESDDSAIFDMNTLSTIWSNVAQHLAKHQRTMKLTYDKSVQLPAISIGQVVYHKTENLTTNQQKLSTPRFTGPYVVTELNSPNVKIKCRKTGSVIKTHLSKLKFTPLTDATLSGNRTAPGTPTVDPKFPPQNHGYFLRSRRPNK